MYRRIKLSNNNKCGLSVWQKTKNISQIIGNFLWKVQRTQQKIRGQTADKTIAKRANVVKNDHEKTIIWNSALSMWYNLDVYGSTMRQNSFV